MWQFFLAIAGFFGILFAFKFLFSYFAPFFLGLFFALMLDLPLSNLEKRGWSRNVFSFILVAVMFLIFPVVFISFLVKLWYELQSLFRLEQLGEWAEFFQTLPLLHTQLNQVNFTGLFTIVFRWAMAIPDLLFIWTLTAIFTYFFCKDKNVLTRFITNRLLNNHSLKFFHLYHKTSGALWDLLQVQFLFMFISTVISVLFFTLLRIPYSLILALLVGLFDFLPILGPGLIYLPLSIFKIASGNFVDGVAIFFAYLIVLTLRQWGEPNLVSNKLGLHPLVALLGIYIGFKIWGLFGAILGPIILVFIKTFMEISELV